MTRPFRTAAVLAAAWAAAQAPAARAAFTVFTDRAAFEAAATGTTTIDFEGLAPPDGFQFFGSPPGLTVSGVNFQATPGTNNLFVIDPGFNPGFNFPSGQFLQNNSLAAGSGINVALPAGITAFGTDVSAQFPPDTAFTLSVTFGTGEGFVLTLPSRPALSFVGFTSDAPITTVAFRSDIGGVTLDNVTVGQVVPEPASVSLLAAGALGLAGYRLRRRAPA